MKCLNKTVVPIVLLLVASGCTQPAEPPPSAMVPTLQNATVRFVLEKGDNKNEDTHLSLAITKQALMIARNDDFAGDQEFGDPGNYGPFDLIAQPGITKDQYMGSTTRLTIAPNGEDIVIMNTIVEARFSDGQTITSESGVRSLDHDNRILEFQNP
jgi:hypothetical protein